jgi:MFS family permease
MTGTTVGDAAAFKPAPASMRTVVAASAAGTAFEWYDFFIFGSLVQVISKNFFSQLGSTAGLIASLALFGVGFAFRPIGALIFGGVGDRLGRKAAFLICVLMMGAATFLIGVLPTSIQAGAVAPILLITLRIIQGTALGGQYGGAAIFVAEHAPLERRGYYTGWVQTSAALGLIGALLVILVVRRSVGEAAFAAWGWRLPFFASAILVAASIWMRLKLTESPAFVAMKAAGADSQAPYAEAFGRWSNLKLVLTAFFGVMCAQGAFWYTVFFYADVFMEKFLKVEGDYANLVITIGAIVSAPAYVLFGALSDRVGRKPVMWFGMVLGLVALFPAFTLISQAANPALTLAAHRAPVTVLADPADCTLQFDITGKAKPVSGCDIAKSILANSGVDYANRAAPAGSPAVIEVGGARVPSADGRGLTAPALKALTDKTAGQIAAALKEAGYPAHSDPGQRNTWLAVGAFLVLVIAATALYGPMAAALAELFPTRIRYTALSLPYHMGTGWIGGFQPVVSFSIVVATGNIYAGLWYPAVFTAISVVCCLFFFPETRGRSLAAT